MNTTALNILRIAVVSVITGLTAAYAYYPTQLWIPAVISALSVVAAYVVPAIGQTMITINPPTALTQMHVTTHEPFTGE